jgi:hypothetical protein
MPEPVGRDTCCPAIEHLLIVAYRHCDDGTPPTAPANGPSTASSTVVARSVDSSMFPGLFNAVRAACDHLAGTPPVGSNGQPVICPRHAVFR